MPESFDPYHKWLGIPPQEQPPHAYRLLGVQLFETDLDVIETAAEQRMALLRTRQTGAQSQLSQQLLNEVSAARVTLLHPTKKAAYDEQLRAKLNASAPKQMRTREEMPVAKALPVAAVAMPVAPQPASVVPELQFESGSSVSNLAKKKSSSSPILFAAIGAGVILVGALVFLLMRGGKTPEKNVASLTGGQTSGYTNAQQKDAPGTSPATVQEQQPDNTTDSTREESRPAEQDPAKESVIDIQPMPSEKESIVSVEKPVAGPKDSPPVASAQPWPFETPTVDLLASASELPADAKNGWTEANGNFVSPASGNARLTLTEKPLDSYKLSFEMQRTSGDGLVAIGFPLKDRQFVYVFDSSNDPRSGLDGWEGKTYRGNATSQKVDLLGTNKPTKIEIEARTNQLTVRVDGKLTFNEKIASGPWQTLRASNLRTQASAKFKLMDDGSYLLEAPLSDRDVYAFEAPTNDGPIAAIRLEALPDPSLPVQGPGAAGNGNFVLNSFALETAVAKGGDFQPLELTEAVADFSQAGFDVASCIRDGQPGWAVEPNQGKRSVAVFLLKEPLKQAANLRVKMGFEYGYAAMLGRFRISVADSLETAKKLPFELSTQSVPLDPRWQAEKPPGVFVFSSDSSAQLAKVQLSKSTANATRSTIDVLAKIDIERDQLVESWTKVPEGLRCEGNQRPRLKLPISNVSDAYLLSISVKRLDEARNRAFGLGFVMQGHRGFYAIDYENATGLHQLAGVSFDRNASTYKGPIFQPGKVVHLELIVVGNRVRLSADGKIISNWQGDPASMNVDHYWDIPDKTGLFIGADSPHIITSIQYTAFPMAGSRPEPAVASSRPREISRPAPTLQPPPGSDELLAGRKAMREKYSDIFEDAKTNEEKYKLAEALIQQGSAQNDDLLERYVLLEEARTIGEDLGNYQLTMRAVDQLARKHKLDREELIASAFLAAIKKVRTPSENAAAARTGMSLIDQLAETNIEAAESIRKTLSGLAAKARSGDLLRDVRDASANMQLRKKLYDASVAAEEALQKDPQNKTAHLAAGTYLAVCTDATVEALQHLVLGDNEELAALCKTELSAPNEVEARLQLAGKWQAWGTSKGGDLKSFALERAVRWYQSAVPMLTGLNKAKAEKDLGEAREALDGAAKMKKTRRASSNTSSSPIPNSGSIQTANASSLQILDARYGADTRWLECTKDLAALVKDGRLVASSCVALVGGDPAYGTTKTTRIRVSTGGREVQHEFREGQPILLEATERRAPRPTNRDLIIVDARVGAGIHWADVKSLLESRVKDNLLKTKIDATAFVGRDLAPNTPKLLFIEWYYNGKHHAQFHQDLTDISIGVE